MDKKKVFTSEDRKEADGPYMDNPEQIPTDKESIYDMHDDMKTVDVIPLEDARLDWKDEQNQHHTKDNSSSEEKYKGK